jgi:hypothetical protein
MRAAGSVAPNDRPRSRKKKLSLRFKLTGIDANAEAFDGEGDVVDFDVWRID